MSNSLKLKSEIIFDIKIMARFALMKGKVIETSINAYEDNMEMDELMV